MNQDVYVSNLFDLLDQLNLAKKHLETSLKRCQSIKPKAHQQEDELIQFEALTSRFARTADMLIHKVYRSIDAVELSEGGTMIDILNRAEKRLLINSVSEIRRIKDLRNEIAHEYIIERLWLLHEEVFKQVPALLDLIDRANNYAKKYRKQ